MVEIALRRMSWALTDRSTSVQIITWTNIHRGVCRHMTSLGHSDWKLGAHTIYELHFGKRPEPYRSADQFILQWRHNERDGAPIHQPHDSLLSRLFGRRSKKISKFRVTGLCERNSPVVGVWPAQGASNAETFPFDDVIMIHSWFMSHEHSSVVPDWARWSTQAPSNVLDKLAFYMMKLKREILRFCVVLSMFLVHFHFQKSWWHKKKKFFAI